MRKFLLLVFLIIPCFGQMPTAAQIEDAEARIRTNPEDSIRGMLVSYYGAQGNREARLTHVIWLIEHHPEWPVTGMAKLPPGTPLATREDYERGKQLWLENVKQRPGEARVHLNAGTYFDGIEPALALQEYRAAYQLDPANRVPLARLYSSALVNPERFDAASMHSIRDDLDATKDAQLLWIAGSFAKARGQAEQAAPLMDKAKALDPKVEEAFAPKNNPPPSFPETPGVKRIVVAGSVQAPKLRSQEPPVYPELATKARLQGTVRFHVLIGADGHVKATQLISGHPLLVPAAQAALMNWTYQTTLLNGVPVEVVSVADVNFTLK